MRIVAVALVSWLLTVVAWGEPRLEVVTVSSRVLKSNPLHDSADRKIAVLLPTQFLRVRRLPLLVYLPGFGDSSENVLRDPKPWLQMVQRLADEGTPMVVAVVDGRNRFGGSQYINSAASGRYLDHICDEVVPELEKRYRAGGKSSNRLIAGHSSGGFGALRVGMARHRMFGNVIALSPDSDFATTHLPILEESEVKNAPLADIDSMMPPRLGSTDSLRGSAGYILALSADYCPSGAEGKFVWPYDETGALRDDAWQSWLENDPLYLAERDLDAFAPSQRIFLDGASHDEFRANIGARRIWEVLNERKSPCTFEEPEGGHSDHVLDRLTRGVNWCFGAAASVKESQ